MFARTFSRTFFRYKTAISRHKKSVPILTCTRLIQVTAQSVSSLTVFSMYMYSMIYWLPFFYPVQRQLQRYFISNYISLAKSECIGRDGAFIALLPHKLLLQLNSKTLYFQKWRKGTTRKSSRSNQERLPKRLLLLHPRV